VPKPRPHGKFPSKQLTQESAVNRLVASCLIVLSLALPANARLRRRHRYPLMEQPDEFNAHLGAFLENIDY
jgi:hypothetical protein